MDDNLKIKKLYQDLEKFKSRKFNCYVDNEDERHELLLIKMMKYVSQNCPASDYNLMVQKLKLSEEDVNKVNSTPDISKNAKMLSLFASWRLSKSFSALEAQDKFIHLVDLAHLQTVVARLNAFRVYAKAVAF